MEMVYFCKQYNEKKEILRAMTSVKAVDNDGMPKSSIAGNPTETQTLKKISLEADINMIEQTAMETAPEIYQELLLNVVDGISYIYLNVPCGKKYFYNKRREFFYRLSEKK